ncbi:MAG: hypothetical protein EXX96DRAFT_488624 [Benjaminiella poitrasii]|nr:MAG: hypothetical protein EXX96DRAFT_488624 [Benjaminiella poitrasii]
MSTVSSQKIETVRKESFFSEEVTKEEREIIAQRIALQQRQFAAYEYREKIRKSTKIQSMFDYVDNEEIIELLNDCNQDEDEAIYRLTIPNYMNDIRKKIALKYCKEEHGYAPLMSADQSVAYQQLLKKRSVTLKKTTNDQAKKQYRMCARLGLDEALEQIQKNQIDPEKAFEGWSEARIKAYKLIDQNPNSYYYRFNAPGEVQRRGQWDEDEKKLFHKRLNELGANGQWGLFSMTIPGRVGYQCSNYYRLLIETKQIIDPNYILDEQGKAHYLFDKKNASGKVQKAFRTHSKHAATDQKKKEATPASSTTDNDIAKKNSRKKLVAKAGTRRRRPAQSRGFSLDDSDEGSTTIYDDDDSGSFTSHLKRRSGSFEREYSCSKRQNQDSADYEEDEIDPTCPLPGFIDTITLDQVVKPAISKYGHVMGYDSWIRCLNNWEGKRNICPITKKPLTKRDLVILTFDNIDEYRYENHSSFQEYENINYAYCTIEIK